jgi:hypothetical protein
VGKVSICQNSGPGGKWAIFFSATGVTANFCGDAAESGGGPETAVAVKQNAAAAAFTSGCLMTFSSRIQM